MTDKLDAIRAKTTRFDAADFLETPEDVVAYLDVVLESGDPAEFAHALGTVARSKGMTEIAKTSGVTRESLYRALSKDGDPRLSTLFGVISSLGLRFSVASQPHA